jgi:hypothetical protein
MQFSKLTVLALASLFMGAYSAPSADVSANEVLPFGIEARDLAVGEVQFVEREVELPEDFGVDADEDDEDVEDGEDDYEEIAAAEWAAEEEGTLEKRAASGTAIINAAKKMKGKKYVWGGGGCKGPSKGTFYSMTAFRTLSGLLPL